MHAQQLIELADENVACTATLVNRMQITGVWSRMAVSGALACDQFADDNNLGDQYVVVNPDHIVTVAVSDRQPKP